MGRRLKKKHLAFTLVQHCTDPKSPLSFCWTTETATLLICMKSCFDGQSPCHCAHQVQGLCARNAGTVLMWPSPGCAGMHKTEVSVTVVQAVKYASVEGLPHLLSVVCECEVITVQHPFYVTSDVTTLTSHPCTSFLSQLSVYTVQMANLMQLCTLT